MVHEVHTGGLANADDGVLITTQDDPSSIAAFCCGTDVPVLHPESQHEQEKAAARRRTKSYGNCPLYIARREAEMEAKLQLPDGSKMETFDLGDGYRVDVEGNRV